MSKLKSLRTITLICLIPMTSTATPNQISSTYGPIKVGDQLWEIAAKVRPDPSVSRHQVMLALLKANPQAFKIPCNINSLKVGQTLNIPTLSDMQTLTAAKATEEYHRQNNEWKLSRKQGKPIVCGAPMDETSADTETAEPILSAIKTAFGTATPEPNLATSSVSTPAVAPPVIENKVALPVVVPVVNESAENWIMVVALTTVTLLILSFSSGWFLQKRTKLSPVKARRYDLTEDEKKPWHFESEEVKVTTSPTSKTAPPPAEESPPVATATTVGTKEKSAEVEDKLAYIRTYLAEGEDKAVQRLLKEVIERGTTKQQEEAQQLIEISRKMSTLELQVGKGTLLSSFQPAATSESTALQEVVQVGKHTSLQKYLPENEAKVFDLIDKIFDLLDRELNAQGKLVEAYLNRHRPNFLDAENYTVLRKPEEKVVVNGVETSAENSPPFQRQAPRPTRHL